MLEWYISKLEAENRQLKAMIGDAEFVSQFDAETRARFDQMINAITTSDDRRIGN